MEGRRGLGRSPQAPRDRLSDQSPRSNRLIDSLPRRKYGTPNHFRTM